MTNVYIETYGCSQNFADSEQMAGLLKEARFEMVDNLEEGYIVILNTCTLKGTTELVFFKRLAEIKEQHPNKLVLVAGCIAQTDPEKLEGYSLVGTKQIHHIVEIVEEALNDNIEVNLSNDELPPLLTPKVRKNPIIEMVPITRGCLGACSYCKTKAARGNLVSYPAEEIKKQVRKALNEGVKEVWLTSQDCGCYGFDINTNLPALLKELCLIEKDFKIRIGMMNPEHLKKIKDELLTEFKDEKVYKFLHVPVQSGNDEVLKNMNRKYTVKEFVKLIEEFKNAFPIMTLATDIMVGFPGETDEQYWDSLNLMRKINPDVVNISKFWPRPKTLAAEMKGQVRGEEMKRRLGVLRDIFHNIARLQNERWSQWEGEVLIDKPGAAEGQWIGRNFAYKQVLVNGNFKLGQKVKIKIEKVNQGDLIARAI